MGHHTDGIPVSGRLRLPDRSGSGTSLAARDDGGTLPDLRTPARGRGQWRGSPGAHGVATLLPSPLVVAQWINAQYYFSAVAPTVFGAGDKTTHNVVGDVGVMRGAHGDLRTGLPWQALFSHEPGTTPDAVSLAHPPARLLGVVVADPAAVLEIISRHDGVGQLICNKWIHLVCIDRGQALKQRRDLTRQPW